MSIDETQPPSPSEQGTCGQESSAQEAIGPLPQRGEVVLGRYRIERELGRGGQAFVFEARDVELDRLVALKVLAPTVGGRGDWQGLLEEARLQAAVEAPGVARLLDALRDGERRYLVMELVRGPGLKEVIGELRDRRRCEEQRPRTATWLAEAAGLGSEGPVRAALERRPWDRAVADFGVKLSHSVGCLHERGLIHRDLKPGNIKLDDSGDPVVLDFGLARWLDAPAKHQVAGTPGYMAPEQLVPSGAQLDERTDVYQIGLILYELLTFERAYPDVALHNTPRYLMLASVGSVPDLRGVDPGADEGLAAVLTRALAPDPEARYASLEDLALDLERIAHGRAPAGAPTSSSYRLRLGARRLARRPVGVVLLAAAVLVPSVWTMRAAFLQEVTSVEGWRYSPAERTKFDVFSDDPVHVGDDLGVRVSTSKPTFVYVLSLFDSVELEERLVSPMRPVPLVDGEPRPGDEESWGLRLAAGTHDLICTRIEDPNLREGLLVFAAGERLALLEGWLEGLDERRAVMPFGIQQEIAFAVLDQLRDPAGARGGAVLAAGPGRSPEDLVRERERYAGLTASTAAGLEEWDLGRDLIRFELLCEVVAE